MVSHSKDDVFTIVQGPDRLAILMAFVDYSPNIQFGLMGNFPEAVSFVTKDGKRDVRFFVMVSGLQHENGSGKSWNIEGYLVRANPIPLNVDMRRDPNRRTRRVHINYRTDKKEGSLRILPN